MEFGLSSTLIYITGILLVLVLGVIGAFVYQIMGSRFQRPRIILQQREDLPEYLLKLYESAFDQLTELGFTPHHFQLSQDIVAHERADRWCMIMVNRSSGVFAEIAPASTFLDMPGYEADFWSVAKDGTALLTYNGRGHTVFCEIPGVHMHDPLKNSLAEQYQSHLMEQTVFRREKQLTLLNPATYVKLQQKLMDGYFLKLIKDGALISIGNNQFRLTLGKALKLIGQLIKGEAKVGKLARAKFLLQMRSKQIQGGKKSAQNGKSDSSHPTASNSEQTAAEFPVEAEVAAYLRLRSAREYNSVGVMGKVIMFILTVVLSYFAFGLVFSFNSVLILLAVIFFHELGHIAAMYLFKYRDLQILFIPLLGAAATGKKENVAVWKQVMVYLMGPMPGIIIGIILIAFNKTWQAPFVYETAIMLLVINYLNLLPFVPLDGGHIVRLTIMERFPTGKLVFTALSGIAFLIGGFYLGEPVFWVLAIIMLASLPMSKLETRVLKELYADDKVTPKTVSTTSSSTTSALESPTLEKPSLENSSLETMDVQGKITRVFETLRKPQFSKLNFSDKFNLVKSLSEVILQQRHCNWQTTLSLSGLYLGALLLTPPAVMLSAIGINQTADTLAVMTGEIPTRDWDKDIANETDLDKRFELTMGAAQFYTATKNLPLGLSYLQQSEADANTLNKSDKFARLYHAYSFYYQQLGDMNQAEQALQKAIDIGMKASDKNHVQLATHFQSLANLKQKQGDLKEYESDLLTALLFAKQIEKPSERFIIANILDQLIELFTRQKQYHTGIVLLQQTISELDQNDDPAHKYIVRYAYQELGWLFENSGDSKSALENFNKALILMPVRKSKSKDNLADAENTVGDPMEKVNLLLAMAYIQNKYENFATAQTLVENADTIAQQNYFSSISQYIESFQTDVVMPDDEERDRTDERWHAIADAYQNILKHKAEAETG